MKFSNTDSNDIRREIDGSINYEYYQHRAHVIRSQAISHFFNSWFRGKKTSTVSATGCVHA